MSNVDAPDVSSGETNNPDLLAEQSGMPNMSSTKTFTVDTNMQVNGDLDVTGTVTATSFVGDGSQLTGISGGTGGGGLDSAAVTLLVDSDYVQARETPQDFAYSSLTGAPTALSSFTNDTSYITAADIPTTVDSDYVQARVTLDGVGLDSAGVTALVDSDYVAARAPAGGGLDSAATIDLIGMQNKPAGNNAIQITPDTSTLNGDNNNIIIGTQISDMAGIGPQAVAMGYDIGAQANGVSIGYQAGAGSQSTNTGGVFIGSRTNYFGNSNPADYAIAIGHEAGSVYPGVGSVALGKSAGAGSSGDYTVAIGYNANNTSSFNNTIMIKADGSAAYNSTAQYDIDIRTSAAGSLTYDTTNDWTFGSTVNAPAFVGDGSGLTNLPAGGGLDSAAVQGLIDDNLLGGVSDTGVVIGPSASADATKLQMTVVGPSAFTNGAYNVAVGRSASVQSGEEFAVAIGNQARAGFSTGGLGGVSIGSQSTVQYDYGVAVGMLAEVKNLNGVALGYQAEVTGSQGIAVGSNALATQTNGVAIGKGTTASQVNSIAIGGDNNTFARSLASICIGEDADNADATNNYSIVIGKDASVTGTNNPDTVTIGRASRAGGSYAIGLGYLSRADAENALVINASGTNREVTSQYGIDIRTSSAGSLTYDTTNDWTFGAGVTMTDLTASGATVVFSNLPTTDPVNAGQLWNDNGTLKVSAG